MPILCTFYLDRNSSDEVEIKDITLRLTPDIEKSLFSGKKGSCKYIEQLSKVSNDTYKLPAGSADLSSYLYALSTHNRLPDRETIAELLLCNATVNQVRGKFKNGRANIVSDIIKRPQIVCEMYYAREHLFKEGESNEMAKTYARSLFVDCGLCGEMAVQAATEHSQKTQSQGLVSRVSSEVYKHSWAETDRCVIDPWAHGPAILIEDAFFSAQAGDSLSIISKSFGQEILEKGNQLLKRLQADDNNKKRLNEHVRSINNFVQEIWPETSVIHNKVKRSIIAKHKAKTASPLGAVNSQIRATGVLRAMNEKMGIKEATAGCESVLEAFDTRFKKGYLEQWRSE